MLTERVLDDRVAVITGASSGIGRKTALRFAEAGADIVLISRNEHRLHDVQVEITDSFDVTAVPVPTDVRDEEMVETAIERTTTVFDSLDILVHSAGVIRGFGTDLAELSTENYRTMMQTNIDGVFFVTRAAIPHLRDSGGNLIFVGSFAGRYPRRYNPVYAASKWWIRGFSYCMEATLGEDGVAVSVINPSAVLTDFSDEDGEPWKERFTENEASRPGEIADAIVFAAKQDHSTVSEINIHPRDKYSTF